MLYLKCKYIFSYLYSILTYVIFLPEVAFIDFENKITTLEAIVCLNLNVKSTNWGLQGFWDIST